MTKNTIHFGAIGLQILGFLSLVAGQASLIPGPTGIYAGIAATALAGILHAINGTPPAK